MIGIATATLEAGPAESKTDFDLPRQRYPKVIECKGLVDSMSGAAPRELESDHDSGRGQSAVAGAGYTEVDVSRLGWSHRR